MSDEDICGIFPNLIWKNHMGIKEYHGADFYDPFATENDILYFHQILDYLKCSSKLKIFPEGNCMMLSKKIIDFIFKDNIKIFYNILNDDKSFDYNWVNNYYKMHRNNIYSTYNCYLLHNLFGNKNQNGSLIGGMIEHVFERI